VFYEIKTWIKMVLSTPQGGEHIDENYPLLHLQRGVKMVSGKPKPPHYSNQIGQWSSKTTTFFKSQWKMVSGQPTKPPHKESKAQSWIPSRMNH
jgi:hypothetical protein